MKRTELPLDAVRFFDHMDIDDGGVGDVGGGRVKGT
jgi:hypothetical protein